MYLKNTTFADITTILKNYLNVWKVLYSSDFNLAEYALEDGIYKDLIIGRKFIIDFISNEGSPINPQTTYGLSNGNGA